MNKAKLEPTEENEVAIMTSDYAMQNVILQMGLSLLSADGNYINRTRKWAKRCSSCTTIFLDCELEFCQSCGNHTLFKISVSVNKNGETTFHHNPNWKPNLRGTKYSIPKPTGGRNSQDLILREDQLSMGGRDILIRKERKKFLQGIDNVESVNFFSDHLKPKFSMHNLSYGYGKKSECR